MICCFFSVDCKVIGTYYMHASEEHLGWRGSGYRYSYQNTMYS